MKKTGLIFIYCFLFATASFAQLMGGFGPGQMAMPVKLKNPYAFGLVNSGKHTSHSKKNSRKAISTAKVVSPAKHLSFFRRVVKHEHTSLAYQGTGMGFEVRKYLHRHKVIPYTPEPLAMMSREKKPTPSGYYMGTDFFDQFAETEQPGILPDYSTTGLFGSYAYKNRTYLTFHNAFGTRLEFGCQSIRGGDVVIDLAVKAGFQYIDNNTTGLRFSDETRNLFQMGASNPNANLTPSLLGSIRIGWVQ
jgi:hypothetical protein